MNGDAAPVAKDASLFSRACLAYRSQTGRSPGLWALLAVLSFAVQVAFRRELKPGEFGTLNTALAVVGLLTVPALALQQAFRHYLARSHASDRSARVDSLRDSALLATETFAWIWGAISLVLIFSLGALLDLPRVSLQIFTLINLLVCIGGVISISVCEREKRLRLWAALVVFAAFARLVVGAGLAAYEPWAESGLAAFLLAGFITLVPALEARDVPPSARLAACRAVLDRDFILCAGATFSVLLGVFLFSSADRIVSQTWLKGGPGFITAYDFDAYQCAGLIARSLLWGTQPLLWIVFAERSRLTKTTKASMQFFWIYLATLLAGVIFLFVAKTPVSQLFCGEEAALNQRLSTTAELTAFYIPTLAITMIPLALLQGLGIFSLASQRHPECFVLGGCSIGYTLILFFFGRQPALMPAYMCGASVVSLMIILFVGVVRWGRKQP